MDAKTTILHVNLHEKKYMWQHEGFVQLGCEHQIRWLLRSLYDLKQAPYAWLIPIATMLVFNA